MWDNFWTVQSKQQQKSKEKLIFLGGGWKRRPTDGDVGTKDAVIFFFFFPARCAVMQTMEK